MADRLEKAVATGKAGISKKNNADLVVLTKDGSAISLTISNVNVDKVVDGKKVWDKDHTIDQLVKDPEVWQQFKEYTEWMMPAFGEAASA